MRATVPRMVEGFVYVSDERPGPMLDAWLAHGHYTLWIHRGSWFDHELDAVVVGSMAGSAVSVHKRAAQHDEARLALARAAENLRTDARLHPGFAVDVLPSCLPMLFARAETLYRTWSAPRCSPTRRV